MSFAVIFVMRGRCILCLLLAALVPIFLRAERGAANRLKTIEETYCPAIVNDPFLAEEVTAGSKGAAALRAQILLGLRHFSAGEIDGVYGRNLRAAVIGFQRANSLPLTGNADQPTWMLLNQGAPEPLVQYAITPEDLAEPFRPIPQDMMEKSKLDALGYRSSLEMLAERFHSSPTLLRKLNPGKLFDVVGTMLIVPNVFRSPLPQISRLEVSEAELTLTTYDQAGALVSQYPATVGSTHDPLPVGMWKVEGVHFNPVFFYNPKLFWDADLSHSKARIAPGPNNPVGTVWIDLSKPHYGIHGTPEPSGIGHTQSHGCIRLTNWDASELAGLVQPGMAVIFKKE